MTHVKVWKSRCTRRWMWCCAHSFCPASMVWATRDSHAAALTAALDHIDYYAPEVPS